MRKSIMSFIVLSCILLLTSCSSAGGGTAPADSQPSSQNPAEQSGTGGGTAAPEQEVKQGEFVIRAATAWPQTDFFSQPLFSFKEKIEASSEGRIKVEYVGGPESIPPFDQGEALRTGVIDMSVLSASYYASQLPEALVINYSTRTMEEEKSGGGIDFLNQLHNEKMNVQLLNRASVIQYNIFTSVPVESMEDFKGLRIRATPVYVPVLKALGAQPVTMPNGEIYPALERGVIDGYAMPRAQSKEFALQEQAKYKIFPSFYNVDAVMVMNLDKWKSLPADVQQLVQKASDEVLAELPGKTEAYVAEEESMFKDLGIQFVELPSDSYLKIALDAGWQWIEENTGENYDKLKSLFYK